VSINLLSTWPTRFARRVPFAWPLAVFVAFSLVGTVAVYVKLDLLAGNWEMVARWLGYLHAEDLQPAQRLSFLYQDLLAGFLLLPAAAVLLLTAAPLRVRLPLAAVLGTIMLVVLFIEVRAHATVGDFISMQLIIGGLHWGARGAVSVSDYFPLSAVLKFSVAVVAVIALLTVGHLADRLPDPGQPRRYMRLAHARTAVPMACALVLVALPTVVLSSSETSVSPLQRSALGLIFAAMSLGRQVDDRYRDYSYEQLIDAARDLTVTRPVPDAGALDGTMKNADVIVFPIETGPARVLDLMGSGRQLPGIAELAAHAFIGAAHHSTYPYTSDAIYSILSGLYPYDRRFVVAKWRGQALPGLLTSLKSTGYATAVFAPDAYQVERDATMYRAFGAETTYLSNEHPQDASHGDVEATFAGLYSGSSLGHLQLPAHFVDLVRHDLQALTALENFIRQKSGLQQRYALVYLPGASHAPWHGAGSIAERGRAQMELQALSLNAIIAVLRETGRLQDTIIVLTADHGIRTRVEDPSLPPGRADPYMFRVPLLVYAPRALADTRVIDAPTSHIDITPTVLALLGHRDALRVGEGIPIWQASAERRIYLLAKGYAGFDGYLQDAVGFMTQYVAGTSFVSPGDIRFQDGEALGPRDPRNRDIRQAIDAYSSLQGALAETLTRP
jgi:hypothetical protein